MHFIHLLISSHFDPS